MFFSECGEEVVGGKGLVGKVFVGFGDFAVVFLVEGLVVGGGMEEDLFPTGSEVLGDLKRVGECLGWGGDGV